MKTNALHAINNKQHELIELAKHVDALYRLRTNNTVHVDNNQMENFYAKYRRLLADYIDDGGKVLTLAFKLREQTSLGDIQATITDVFNAKRLSTPEIVLDIEQRRVYSTGTEMHNVFEVFHRLAESDPVEELPLGIPVMFFDHNVTKQFLLEHNASLTFDFFEQF